MLDSVRLAFYQAINGAVQPGPTPPATPARVRPINDHRRVVDLNSGSRGRCRPSSRTKGLIDGLAGRRGELRSQLNASQRDRELQQHPRRERRQTAHHSPRTGWSTNSCAIDLDELCDNGMRPGWISFGTARSARSTGGRRRAADNARSRCQASRTRGSSPVPIGAAGGFGARSLGHASWTVYEPRLSRVALSPRRHLRLTFVRRSGKFSRRQPVRPRPHGDERHRNGKSPSAGALVQANIFSTNGLNTGSDGNLPIPSGGKRINLGVSPSRPAAWTAACARRRCCACATGHGCRYRHGNHAAPRSPTASACRRASTGVRHRQPRNKPGGHLARRSDALVPVNPRHALATAIQLEGRRGTASITTTDRGSSHFDAFLPNAAGGNVQGYDVLRWCQCTTANSDGPRVGAAQEQHAAAAELVCYARSRGGVPAQRRRSPPTCRESQPRRRRQTISVGAGVINGTGPRPSFLLS